MRIIVFDIEIAKRVEDVPRGWAAAREGECGVSCVCLWDSETDRYHVYDQHTIYKCIDHLCQADILVSFNGIGFDIPALEGYAGVTISVDQHYDILAEIFKSAGKKVKGFKLGEVGPRTVGLDKIDTGEHAPTLYEEGRWGELIDYCINDVHMTKELFYHIAETGYVIDQEGEQFEVRRPVLEAE